jgi:hypothetical protein
MCSTAAALGKYEVSAPGLVIRSSGVVLRGEGQGRDGTVLVATSPVDYALITLEGTARRHVARAEGSAVWARRWASPFACIMAGGYHDSQATSAPRLVPRPRGTTA